jgi:DNA-binding MarR family transcriptional regulator
MSAGAADINPAKRAWRLLFDLFARERGTVRELAETFDLTPPQLFLVKEMEPGSTREMGDLACGRFCDRSSLTRMVDRLVQRGLLVRQESQRDRRSKTLMLTSEGETLRRRLIARIEQPPQAFEMLSRHDQEELVRILEDALSNAREIAEAPHPADG